MPGSPSSAGATSRAPKSVADVPVTRSAISMQSTSLTGSKARPARAGTTAYREAAVASAASACSSPRPARHQPGQSTAQANTRLVPVSRYTPVMGTILPGVTGPG